MPRASDVGMRWPWSDYGGRLSPLKLVVFAALFAPAATVMTGYAAGLLGARPLNEAIHQIGLWGIRLLFVALAITPLRQVLRWPRLIVVRRMIGVAAFAYVLLHFLLYAASQGFAVDKVAQEIAARIYLTIGFVALLLLATLAATSTDGMIRRLGGRRWQLLHRLVYPVAVLAVIHYAFQSKLDLWEPTVMAGVCGWLLGYRALLWRFGRRGGLSLGWLAALGGLAVIGTALGEALYFRLAFHADPLRVLGAELTLVTGLRPAAVIAAIAAPIILAGAWRQFAAPRIPRRAPRPRRQRLTGRRALDCAAGVAPPGAGRI